MGHSSYSTPNSMSCVPRYPPRIFQFPIKANPATYLRADPYSQLPRFPMDEVRLIENLRLIEALHAGATTEGEKVASERANERILERLRLFEQEDPAVEFRFSMGDMWSRKLFVAMLKRYNIQPFRYRNQRHTTVMAKVSKRFVDETLWPEFQEISKNLDAYLSDVTDRVIRQVLQQESSEAEVVDKPKQLPHGSVEPQISKFVCILPIVN